MRKTEIEAWALEVIDRVARGQPVEDSRVELKREWLPDHAKAARRIAGHANAARGEPILWLIGVDEKSGTVPGADNVEFSDWWRAVASKFSELSPSLVDLVVPFGGVSVCALYMETERAPYVVKNPEGGQVSLEVPWREGTSVKTANRSQLIQVLSPVVTAPQIQALECQLSHSVIQRKTNPEFHAQVRLDAKFFITQPQGQHSIFAEHNTSISARVGLTEWEFTNHIYLNDFPSQEIIGPGYLTSRAALGYSEDSHHVYDTPTAIAKFKFIVPNYERTLSVELTLNQLHHEENGATWCLKAPTPEQAANPR